jgi:hypothetical protein
MLACDLILEVRASRSLNAEQVSRLERMVFGQGRPDREQLDLLFVIDAYVMRADPAWAALLARAALSALVAGPGSSRSAMPMPAGLSLESARRATAA